MTMVLMVAAAAAMLAVAAYAQYQVPNFTAGRDLVLMTRAMLAGVGLAFGWVSAANLPNDPAHAALAFCIGFGVVHFPAACILFFKRESGAGKS